jgi:hypothetical protein
VGKIVTPLLLLVTSIAFAEEVAAPAPGASAAVAPAS